MPQNLEFRRSIESIRESLLGPLTFESIDACARGLSQIGAEIALDIQAAFAEAVEITDRSAA